MGMPPTKGKSQAPKLNLQKLTSKQAAGFKERGDKAVIKRRGSPI